MKIRCDRQSVFLLCERCAAAVRGKGGWDVGPLPYGGKATEFQVTGRVIIQEAV